MAIENPDSIWGFGKIDNGHGFSFFHFSGELSAARAYQGQVGCPDPPKAGDVKEWIRADVVAARVEAAVLAERERAAALVDLLAKVAEGGEEDGQHQGFANCGAPHGATSDAVEEVAAKIRCGT